ncbi:MAG: FRG domain-containing protein [Proteobacteria bacterium]|nr:MAG: FRG domain-containing protein [Pseudomonadota bacterium]
MTKAFHIDTETVGSLPDFLSRVEERCTGCRNVLFRGHSVESWKLEPKLARIPIRPPFDVPDAEAKMFLEFKRRASSFAPKELSTDWDWLALAQHHGLPTRLLDWTTNALVALWFALERPPVKDQDGAVWIFFGEPSDYADDREIQNPFAIQKTLIYRPRHSASRISAQSGWFTAHRLMPSKNTFMPLEQIKVYKDRLIKLVIPGKSFGVLREDLNRCGINSASIFADLDGLSRQVAWEFSPPLDEEEFLQEMARDLNEPGPRGRLTKF